MWCDVFVSVGHAVLIVVGIINRDGGLGNFRLCRPSLSLLLSIHIRSLVFNRLYACLVEGLGWIDVVLRRYQAENEVILWRSLPSPTHSERIRAECSEFGRNLV